MRVPHMAISAPTGAPADAATFDQLLALARFRRSVRVVDPDRPVSDETIEKILEVARWAPSAGNGQPWEFLVIRDKDTRERIAALYTKQIAEKREMQKAIWGRSTHLGYSSFRKSPVLLLLLCDRRVKETYPIRTQLDKGESHLVSSMASATLLVHLAVASLGLASQWVSDVASPYMSTMLRSMLGIPRHLEIYDMTGVGYPARMPEVPERRPLEDMIHRERYEPAKARDDATVMKFLLDYTRIGWEAATAERDDPSAAEERR